MTPPELQAKSLEIELSKNIKHKCATILMRPTMKFKPESVERISTDLKQIKERSNIEQSIVYLTLKCDCYVHFLMLPNSLPQESLSNGGLLERIERIHNFNVYLLHSSKCCL